MSNWLVCVFCGIFIALSIGCSAAVADDKVEPAQRVYTLTSGRLTGIAGTLIGLIGVVAGGLALRLARRGGGAGRMAAFLSLAAGLIGAGLGGLVVAGADAFGTGRGLAGGIVALVVALMALCLGGAAFARSGRAPGQ